MRRYIVHDDSVTVRGKGHPEYSGKSVTPRGERQRDERGPSPDATTSARTAIPRRTPANRLRATSRASVR